MLASETQNMAHAQLIVIVMYILDISGLAAELQFFGRAAVVANRGPNAQMGAGNKRYHPVRSLTRGCLGAEDRGGGAMGG